jgi:polyphenol oxidase
VPVVELAWETRHGVPLLFAPLAGAVVAFTTRQGGVSEGSFASLNLGFATPDAAAGVAENRRRALAAAGADPLRAQALRQRHGDHVVEAGAVAAGSYLDAATAWPEGDALATSQPGVPLVAHGADCLTAALVGPGASLAVVHAGWRGLVAGVLEAAAERVGPGFAAAVGPGAGACCYAVGEDVAERFRRAFGPGLYRDGRLDLWTAAERALRAADCVRVDRVDLCTACSPARFFSHRRDEGLTGRQGVIGRIG